MQNFETISNAISFIENNIYEQISVLDVAKSVSYSYYHFHRFFYSVMNETVGNYIRSRKLTQAASDLIHTKRNIIAISLSLGFKTPESFTRSFKKRFSMTPSDYRKQGLDLLIGNRLSLENTELSVRYVSEPEIMNIAPIAVAGIRFPESRVEDGYTQAWRSFKKDFQQHTANNTFYSIYESEKLCTPNTFDLQYKANVFIGVESSNYDNKENQKLKIIKGGKYAKFTYVGLVENILYFYQYIWGVWLVDSKYELDNRDDFELYTEKFIGEYNQNSEIDIYIPIK